MESEGQDPVTMSQLAEALDRLDAKINEMSQTLSGLVAQNDTRKKLVEAGKRSAAARREKFGSAEPPKKTKLELLPPAVEPVRVPIQDLFDAPATEHLPEPVQSKKRAPKGESPGSVVWAAYETAYRARYGTDPVRNAKVNANCAQLAKSVGVEDARELVGYYLTRNDAFYVRACHPLGLCLIDIQKLRTERYNGNVVTMTDARRIESGSSTDRAIAQYAAQQQKPGCRACGGKGWYSLPSDNERHICGCSEQVREGVQPAEVLQ